MIAVESFAEDSNLSLCRDVPNHHACILNSFEINFCFKKRLPYLLLVPNRHSLQSRYGSKILPSVPHKIYKLRRFSYILQKLQLMGGGHRDQVTFILAELPILLPS